MLAFRAFARQPLPKTVLSVCVCIIEGTAWTDEKQRWEESEKRREEKKEDQKRESLRRKKIQVREKVGKSRHTVFFQWFVAPEAH